MLVSESIFKETVLAYMPFLAFINVLAVVVSHKSNIDRMLKNLPIMLKEDPKHAYIKYKSRDVYGKLRIIITAAVWTYILIVSETFRYRKRMYGV